MKTDHTQIQTYSIKCLRTFFKNVKSEIQKPRNENGKKSGIKRVQTR